MSDRPTPAKVRSVLARIRKVEHWIDSAEYVPESTPEGMWGAISGCETDIEFRLGVVVALSWVAGEYGGDDMPSGISALVQHTNKREFLKLLKDLQESEGW